MNWTVRSCVRMCVPKPSAVCNDSLAHISKWYGFPCALLLTLTIIITLTLTLTRTLTLTFILKLTLTLFLLIHSFSRLVLRHVCVHSVSYCSSRPRSSAMAIGSFYHYFDIIS